MKQKLTIIHGIPEEEQASMARAQRRSQKSNQLRRATERIGASMHQS